MPLPRQAQRQWVPRDESAFELRWLARGFGAGALNKGRQVTTRQVQQQRKKAIMQGCTGGPCNGWQAPRVGGDKCVPMCTPEDARMNATQHSSRHGMQAHSALQHDTPTCNTCKCTASTARCYQSEASRLLPPWSERLYPAVIGGHGGRPWGLLPGALQRTADIIGRRVPLSRAFRLWRIIGPFLRGGIAAGVVQPRQASVRQQLQREVCVVRALIF